MKRDQNSQRKRGYLSRLIREESGNVLMITAFAMIPMLAMVGGAVDTARLYSVKTRMQAACDAGILTGRRVMGNSEWQASGAPVAASRMFDANFTQGYLGSENLNKTFTESNGIVTGDATVVVPMTIMQIMRQGDATVAVTCSGELRIPHTDVMFVLDVTGSMAAADMGTKTRIRALQDATMCFYESLSKEDIISSGAQVGVSNADCGVTASPARNLSRSVQLRFGFAPYATNVNVGGMLPTAYFKNTQTMQSRVPNLQTVQTWTNGPESSPNFGGWSGYSNSSTSGFNNNGQTITIPISENTNSKRSNYCIAQTKSSTSYAAGSPYESARSNIAAPVFPASTANISNVTETLPSSRTVYRYRYPGNGQSCNEQQATETTTQTRSGNTTGSITWTPYQRVVNWTYRQVAVNVSGLKNGATAYNSSVDIPINDVASPPVKVSGSNSVTSLRLQGNLSVPWNGCIEEKQTFRNTDGNESDDWDPIPATAIDMDIDAIPSSDSASQWGYALPNALWGRRDNSGNYTTADVIAGASPSFGYASNRGFYNYCPSAAARRLASYQNNAGAEAFRNYVNSLQAQGNTYHDIGMLWGARMISPTGMFAGNNALTPTGEEINRHIILMTDGDPSNVNYDLSAYGLNWHDRKQVITPATTNDLNNQSPQIIRANIARTLAICERVKQDPNTTLWVIFFNPNTSAYQASFQTCASGPPAQKKFFDARSNAQLLQVFKDIATEISELRITV